MKETIVCFKITVPTDDNKLLNDVIRMIAPMKYLLNRIPDVSSVYTVFEREQE